MKSRMIGILVAVCVLLGIGKIMDLAEPKCVMPGCDNERTSGSRYCFLHDLSYQTYGNPDYHAIYRQSRERQKQTAGTYSANKAGIAGKSGNSSSGSRSVDPYDADEFDNADDFADEWAEEFGDGDFEEGYEDAYDYWEEYMD